MQDRMVNVREEIDESRARQARLDYSSVGTELADLKAEVRNQQEMALTTTKLLQDKILMNKKQSKFHHGLEEIFAREDYL